MSRISCKCIRKTMVLHRKMRVYTHISFLVKITTPSSNFLSVATMRIEYLHLPLNIGYSGICISLFWKNCPIFLIRIYIDFFDITLKVNALNFCTKFCTKLAFFCSKLLSAWGSSEVIYDLFEVCILIYWELFIFIFMKFFTTLKFTNRRYLNYGPFTKGHFGYFVILPEQSSTFFLSSLN